ncbi:MAG: hypothetical protein R3284_09975, partial [Rubricoccaceae bacterium]|nr:hypothetical protein [Rubricoccaceae bacterium]
GARLRKGVEQQVSALGLEDQFGLLGRDCNLVYFTHDENGQPSQAYRTLFIQELLKHGVLAPSFVVSAAHTNNDIDQTVEAVGKSLAVYRKALDGDIHDFLKGRPVKPVFRKFV